MGSSRAWKLEKICLRKTKGSTSVHNRCIIDCTEIKCQTLQDLEKQSELYSKDKSHSTFKGLVGISHNVWITFVSSLYGGSILDKEIVKISSLTDLVEENDLIMMDHGRSKDLIYRIYWHARR